MSEILLSLIKERTQAGLRAARSRGRTGGRSKALTKAGLTAARSRGRSGGRPKALTVKQVDILNQLAADRNRSVAELCKALGISRMTYYRYLNS